mgnify:CR=1 FL=1
MNSSTQASVNPNFLLECIYAFIIVVGAIIFWQRHRFWKLSRQFPGPVEIPFLGILFRILNPEGKLCEHTV